MKLTQIEITGFKSIRDYSIDLAPLNIFIGANGVGKSNLVSFFKLLNHMMTEHLQAYVAKSGWAEALLHYGSKQTPQLTAKLHATKDSGENTYYLKLENTADDTLFFAEELIEFTKKGETSKETVSLGKGH
jgi:predicted ATPase